MRQSASSHPRRGAGTGLDRTPPRHENLVEHRPPCCRCPMCTAGQHVGLKPWPVRPPHAPDRRSLYHRRHFASGMKPILSIAACRRPDLHFAAGRPIDGSRSGSVRRDAIVAPAPPRPCRACPLPRPQGRGPFGGPSKPPRVSACGARLLSAHPDAATLGGGRRGIPAAPSVRRGAKPQMTGCRLA